MAIYWLMFALALFGALAPKRLNKSSGVFAFMAVCAFYTLLMGLRHEVGGDWYTYEIQFLAQSRLSFFEAIESSKDPAYAVVNWVVHKLEGSIHLVNLACAVPLGIGTAQLCSKQRAPWIALLTAVPYLLIVVGMGYTRQSAAIGFAMMGLVALANGRVRLFVVWVLIGAAFHKSAVLLIPIAALAAARNRMWTATWVGVVAIVGAWVFVYESADQLVSNYVESEYADASQGAGIRVLMNAVPAVIFLLRRRTLAPEVQVRNLWTWISVLALACIPLLSISATGVDRVALYFIPLQLFVFGMIVQLSGSVQVRTFLVLGVVAYYALVQFVWLNYASHSSAWIPYEFVPI